MTWTQDPEAAALIASCAARPPRIDRHRTVYAITTDEWTEYSRRDSRIRRLEDLHDAAFLAAEKISREAAIDVLDLTVDGAIDAAIAERASESEAA